MQGLAFQHENKTKSLLSCCLNFEGKTENEQMLGGDTSYDENKTWQMEEKAIVMIWGATLHKAVRVDLEIQEIFEQKFERSEGVSMQILGERAEQTTV